MKNRIIFLDFDGVLNSERTVVAQQRVHRSTEVVESILTGKNIQSGFDPIAVSLIHRLAIITNAKIVISSSWRFTLSLTAIRKLFEDEFGWESGENSLIIGMTPKTDRSHRGEDIEQWITDNATGQFEYIIIDDSSDLLEHHFTRFIKTDADEGFLYSHYKDALKLFYTKDDWIEL